MLFLSQPPLVEQQHFICYAYTCTLQSCLLFCGDKVTGASVFPIVLGIPFPNHRQPSRSSLDSFQHLLRFHILGIDYCLTVLQMRANQARVQQDQHVFIQVIKGSSEYSVRLVSLCYCVGVKLQLLVHYDAQVLFFPRGLQACVTHSVLVPRVLISKM